MNLEDLWAVEPSLHSGFYIQPISLLNPIETSKTVSNLYLDHSCYKYCDLIGQQQVSKSHRVLVNSHRVLVNLHRVPVNLHRVPVNFNWHQT